MKRIVYLLIAILGNGLGSAMMKNSTLGMSVWGAASTNVSNYITVFTPGQAFILVSVLFYLIALYIRKDVVIGELISSMIFLILFSTIFDLFINLLPNMDSWHMIWKYVINIAGMLILLFSIALHLHINFAVHPMDVFLKTMQDYVFKSVVKGTYFAYGCAAFIAILFGFMAGDVIDLSFGTIMILVFGGSIMGLYNRFIIKYL